MSNLLQNRQPASLLGKSCCNKVTGSIEIGLEVITGVLGVIALPKVEGAVTSTQGLNAHDPTNFLVSSSDVHSMNCDRDFTYMLIRLLTCFAFLR